MSAASSVSAASAAVDSPQLCPTASRIVEPVHSRTASEQTHTRSGFSYPSKPVSRLDIDIRLQSAPSTPAKHKLSRSVGAYPVSPSVEARRQGLASPSRAKLVEPNLPSSPNVWTPSELAQYLTWALRSGGDDGRGPTLPSLVIEDVVSWVFRSQVTGRQFITGVDQGVARPPPFLPVLATMSRRLRRTGSRLSDASASTASSMDSDREQVTRVRRLAHAFEHISSASEPSSDEASLSVLREQLTGDSVHGFGRAAPKAEARNWSRRDSVASVASIASGISTGSHALWRPSESGDASATVYVTNDEELYAHSNTSPTAPLRAKAEAKAALELAELADLAHKGADSDSPPPPYAPSPARTGLLFPSASPSVPDPTSSGPLTPLRAEVASSPEPDSPSPSVHMARMGAHRSSGVDPYAVLRRRDGGRPSAMLFTQPEDEEDSDDKEPAAHWTTTRRATVRPRPVNMSPTSVPATPSKLHVSTPGSLRRRREAAVAREVAALTDRIRELEARLAAVETPAASLSGSVLHPDEGHKSEPAPKSRGVLAALGFTDEHGNEPRLQDVPVLLFLLGVGVGAGGCAVVVRVLLQRKIAA
ncbi:hypothetical protein CspHIS471_0106100 [Cutaneotrichosporon sp. HIS471]|nr:hypothetical protein CspHIS471_0106100 [Cutaneotrichosporon sp. HIS471]